MIWTWTEDRTHTVTSDSFTSSSTMSTTGSTHSVTFDTAGTFDYVCSIHSQMLGSIVVVEVPVPTAAGSASPTPEPTGPTASPTSMPSVDLNEKFANYLTYPNEISSSLSEWNFTLVVKEHRHSNTQVAFNTRSYCYEVSVVGCNYRCSIRSLSRLSLDYY